jgi:hypothetical protein
MPAEQWVRYQSLPADENQILAWFADRRDFGVGLIQGSRSGTIVLDFDADSLGLETLADLERRGLPQSVRAFTPGGGCHVILRHPGKHVSTRKRILPGMDVRGDGGFIVACPSVHANGREYAWDVDCHPEEVPVADCPDWLTDLICGEAPAQSGASADIVRVAAPGPLGTPLERVADGREQYMRDTILAVCVDLHGRLGRIPTPEELFGEAWPQYAAKADLSRPGRGEGEFRAKVAYTLHRYESGRIKAKPRHEAPDFGGENIDPETGEILPNVPAGQAGQTGRPALPLIHFADIKPNLDAADFVESLLIEGAMSVVYGPSNCGKTFFMTDLALHIANGQPWRGKEIEQGGVVYCALEGSHGISNRIAAFKLSRKLQDADLPFAIIPVTMNLLDPNADRAPLADAIGRAAAHMGMPVKLVVIDTLSRAMAGGKENAPEDMGALVASADFIRQSTSAHLCFIHHSGKDQANGARGHSLLRAATDTEIEIIRPDPKGPSVARVTKQRELEVEGEFAFSLQIIELGSNRRGKPVTSCVVIEADASEVPDKGPRLSPGAREALSALQEALSRAGQKSLSRDIPENVLVVPLAAWRSRFYATSHQDSQDAKRKAFGRAIKDLRQTGQVGVMHDQAWIAAHETPQ